MPDSYYDFIPAESAQTIKLGVAHAFGQAQFCIVSGYYSVALNDYGTASQYRYNTGVDVTWYPFKNR